ncbi:MAG: DUF1203 domain-containing protein, partial [Bacteroidota bacterium]
MTNTTDFLITGIAPEHVPPATASHVRKLVADTNPGYPCRVSLKDAAIGEEILAFHYEHHAVDSPYRASGPVFVRVGAAPATPTVNEIPPILRKRSLSLRAYDTEAMMVAARTL